MFKQYALILCSILWNGGVAAQQWNVQSFNVNTPVELSAGARRDRPGMDLLSLTREGQGTRLDAHVLNPDGSLGPAARVATATPFVFGVSTEIAGGYSAFVDGAQLKVVKITDGQPGTPVTLSSSPVWGETQIGAVRMPRASNVPSASEEGPGDWYKVVSAYNFQQQAIYLFWASVLTGAWQPLGQLPIGVVYGGLLGGPRITMDLESGVVTIGWGGIEQGTLVYYVQRFALPSLAAVSPRVVLPVALRRDRVTEVQMMYRGDTGAVVTTDLFNRVQLYIFTLAALQYRLYHLTLGETRPNVIGAVALWAAASQGAAYVAWMDPSGTMQVQLMMLAILLARGQGNLPPPHEAAAEGVAELPPIPNAYTGRDDAVPLLIRLGEEGPNGESRKLTVLFPGSLKVAEYSGCSAGRSRLCNSNHRFDVRATWRDREGNTGSARAVPLSGDTGYFWFFNSANVEMVVKVLNGCTINQRFWVFAGGLTDVEVNLTVRDTQNGATKSYHNPLGRAFTPVQDTGAFAGCSSGNASASSPTRPAAVFSAGLGDWSRRPIALSNCLPSPFSLCVNGNRFRVDARWRTRDGRSGSGTAVQLTEDSGYFWFFDSGNVELVVKGLNACVVNNRHWVFAAGLTDVEVETTVTDTITGAVKRYNNVQGTPFQPITDTGAFACR